MFGGTVPGPLVMGFYPNVAILMSGVGILMLVLGTGDFTLKVGDFALGGIGTATSGALILNAIPGGGPRQSS